MVKAMCIYTPRSWKSSSDEHEATLDLYARTNTYEWRIQVISTVRLGLLGEMKTWDEFLKTLVQQMENSIRNSKWDLLCPFGGGCCEFTRTMVYRCWQAGMRIDCEDAGPEISGYAAMLFEHGVRSDSRKRLLPINLSGGHHF